MPVKYDATDFIYIFYFILFGLPGCKHVIFVMKHISRDYLSHGMTSRTVTASPAQC